VVAVGHGSNVCGRIGLLFCAIFMCWVLVMGGGKKEERATFIDHAFVLWFENDHVLSEFQ
jgi:hypothetical protein